MANDAEYSRRYRLRHPERRAASVKAYEDRNREQVAEYRAAYRQRPEVKARTRAYHLMKTYGLSIERFDLLRAIGCPCGNREWDDRPRSPLSPVVDHDRRTGIVRGVIHHICNRSLGVLGDDLDGLERWTDYLRRKAA